MVYVVLVIGLLNLALGFAVGLFVHHRPERVAAPVVETPAAPTLTPAPQPKKPPKPRPDDFEDSFVLAPLDEKLQTQDIPEEWMDLLDEAEGANSFVEASIQVLKLEVGKYRDRLVQVENQILSFDDANSEEVGACLKALKKVNEDWLERQSEAANYLGERNDSLGNLSDLGARLEDILMEQTAQIETTCSNLNQLDHDGDPGGACQRAVPELGRLLLMAHELRDRMQESMSAVLAQEGRLAALEKNKLLDALTGIRNRTGVEKLFDDWWSSESAGTRLLSIAIIDVDHFARINEQMGAIVSDRLLVSVAGLLQKLMSEERNDHVVARLNGQQFLFFFPDCGPRQATSTVERIRQAIYVTSFDYSGHEVQLTASGGVVEMKAGDTTRTMLSRANKMLRAAKKSGRNRTFLEEESKATPVVPPEFKVKARVVRVEDSE